MKNKSKASEFSEYLRNNYPVNNRSLSKRTILCEVGINDADYATCPTVDGKQQMCPAYSAWRKMIYRVYSYSNKDQRPTYKNVEVCKEWLTFSNFRKWFIENHVDTYHLDKDLLSSDVKVYSPDTCVYVPQWLNNFVLCKKGRTKEKRDYKVGACWYKSREKFQENCSNPKTNRVENLGGFDTEDAAHNAWFKRKSRLALELKQEMDTIDLRIYPNVVAIIKNMT